MNHITTSAIGFSSLVQRFFCDRLIGQQNVSMRTVAAYRDTFRLFFQFIQAHRGIAPCDLTFDNLGPDTLTAFLRYLEEERGNTIRTRNARLAAIRSFLHYAAALEPASIATIQRMLAVPMKRCAKPVMGFLTREEIEAILNAPDPDSWNGRRDRVLFRAMYNTGAWVSEIIGVTMKDVDLNRSKCLMLHGKGRKERVVPLWHTTIRELKAWILEIGTTPSTALFAGRKGLPLSRSGVEWRLRSAVTTAIEHCPSLKGKTVSPHTIRHTTAMHLLQSGVDLSVIAIWLGHENLTTTHLYMEADLSMKQRALATLEEPSVKHHCYHAS